MVHVDKRIGKARCCRRKSHLYIYTLLVWVGPRPQGRFMNAQITKKLSPQIKFMKNSKSAKFLIFVLSKRKYLQYFRYIKKRFIYIRGMGESCEGGIGMGSEVQKSKKMSRYKQI